MSANGTIRNLIDHVILVLDESLSMSQHRTALIKQVDGLVKHLAGRSTELARETRVSVWVFGYADNIRCLVWDMDVLRLPSIAEFYNPRGQTALIDATMDAIGSHLEIPQRYGEHAFLTYVLTDGEENNSRQYGPPDLRNKLSDLPDNWTVAALVPNRTGVEYAKRVGFLAGNVDTWDASSAAGVTAVSARIQQTTDRWQDNRSRGQRSTSNLFSTGSDVVNSRTVKAALIPLTRGSYVLNPITVGQPRKIKDYIEGVLRMPYVIGNTYYQFHKTETIQGSKDIAVVSKRDDTVYVGAAARQILNLPDYDVRVKPTDNPEYDIFVKSTSTNRTMHPGTRVLVLR